MERGELESFLQWAAKLGISDSPNTRHRHCQAEMPKSCLGHSLAVSHFPDGGGRGLAAVRDLRKGELVLTVPKSALFTRESSLKDETLASALSNYPSLSPTQILAVCLLYEVCKGKNSQWYPYLSHLPRSYDVLASFSEFQTQALQVDEAIWSTEKAISRTELDWKDATQLMRELELKPQLLSLKAWIWASATISSRTLHIPWDEAGCLCPVGDLFNYGAPGEESSYIECTESWMHALSFQNCSVSNQENTDSLVSEQLNSPSKKLTDGGFDEDIGAYCFYARKNYKTGEQVLLCYGTYTNLELLEHYGFLLHENPCDKVFVPLEPNMYSSNSWSKDALYIHKDGSPSFALLSALRIWATPPNLRRSMGHLAYSGCQLSASNEIAVMKWLSKSCSVILNNLPTTIEEDSSLLLTIDKIQNVHEYVELEKVLLSFGGELYTFLEANDMHIVKDGNLFSNDAKRSIERWKLAVQWRFNYKKIFVECISYCTEIISSLSRQCVDEKSLCDVFFKEKNK